MEEDKETVGEAIIIIIVFSLIALPNQDKVDPRRAKKTSSI